MASKITYAECRTSECDSRDALWKRMLFGDAIEASRIPGIGHDSDYRAYALACEAKGDQYLFESLLQEALGPIRNRIVAADEDVERNRPVVLLSTVMGSRPDHDRSDPISAAEGVRAALDSDTAAVATFLGGHVDVIGIGSGCAAGTTVIGLAQSLVSSGRADMVICLGAEVLSYEVLTLFLALGGLSDDDMVRPFDADRRGMMPGEGFGVVVVEPPEFAKAPLASIAGYGEACDGWNLVAPSPTATGLSIAITDALASASITVDDVGWICAHGTGTRANDALEAGAYDRIFSARHDRVPVVSIKGTTGHCQGAAGVIETVVAVTSLREGVVPPNKTISTLESGIEKLAHVRVPCSAVPLADNNYVLSTSFGFGGSVAAVVIGAP
ncbi:beta-ketoacyl synthase N-terminal-like domain-containing protein [Rhodococcus qingshengii]|uniref:beta-ketoacyl synthase N-terminal-like domain-containing protein n=1 Tax=Rhodococcus qingshengii TaxID=334542 RepID=UPI0036F8E2D8